jgi:predicted alpha/beta-fold hydrolase
MQRIAAKLNARGIRTFRLDQRGWGAAFTLARHPFHGARFADLEAAVAHVANCCPGSPLTVVGFSLGGNITLNVCSRRDATDGESIDSVVAICPPLDTYRCVREMAQQSGGVYDRHFVRVLLRQLLRRGRAGLEASPVALPHRPRSLLEFDTQFTAPSAGFESVEAYYRAVSALDALAQIRHPTLLLRAADDPLAICDTLKPGQWSESVECETTLHGGHMGFIGRAGIDPDRRWMDWRVVDWIAGQGSCGPDQSCLPAQ